jgi:hypothetical protein
LALDVFEPLRPALLVKLRLAERVTRLRIEAGKLRIDGQSGATIYRRLLWPEGATHEDRSF